MESVYQHLHKSTGLATSTLENIFVSLVTILVFIAIHIVLVKTINRRIEDIAQRYQWRRAAGYSVTFLALLMIGRVWFHGVQALSTFLGLTGAGLLIALKDTVMNVAGWMFILVRRPFRVGDRVQIGADTGDVIDVRLFQFSMLEIGNWVDADQSTGRIVHVPNSRVFIDPLFNYTQGFEYIWNELPILVTFESNWQDAKEILQNIASEKAEKISDNAQKEILKAAERYMIMFTKLTPIVYTSVADSGVMLTIRYLTRPRNRRGSAQAIWERVLEEFAGRDDIDFAYPTTRFYNNISEGKPGTKP